MDDISSDNKTCTSCAQKVDQQKDGACTNQVANNTNDIGSRVSKDLDSSEKATTFTFLPPESANGEVDVMKTRTKPNTKNEIFQFGVCSNSGSNSIDKIVEDVGKLGVSDDKGEDNLLFQDPPSGEECPICMLPMPHCCTGACNLNMVYYTCCGKVICGGCILASFKEMKKGSMKRCCPFCRIPNPKTDKELLKRLKNRMKLDDPLHIYISAVFIEMGAQVYRRTRRRRLRYGNRQ